MRPIIIIIMFILFYAPLTAQYSNYYSNIYIGQSKKSQNKVDVNANINQNINANINISGNIVEKKTITTIDYGALELANAQREKNRLEQQNFYDRREKEIAEEIVMDPVNAYFYGNPNIFCMKDFKKQDKNSAKEMTIQSGIKDFCVHHVIPNYKLFSNVGPSKFQNVSSDGVITDITFTWPYFYKDEDINRIDFEKKWSYDFLEVGKEHDSFNKNNEKTIFFLHKKELNRADVFGSLGFKSTLVKEDKFEYEIKDFYVSQNISAANGFQIMVEVIFHGDKDEVDFEKLEGRRYYFRNLIQKIIATGYVDKIKY